MDRVLTDKEAAHSRAVKEMFSGIARRYDLLNHVLSLNIDKGWRRSVRRELADVLACPDSLVLDVACGTGDLAIELQHDSAATVIATDFCRPMLAVARDKEASIPYVEADAMKLSFPDRIFDAVTIAFGLRNLPHHADGIAEMHRILKPGGRLVILECSKPRLPVFRQLYELYFSTVLPRIGGMVSGSRGAYEYLPDSVSKFPDQKTLATMMETAGLTSVEFQNLTGGIAALHSGTKSG
ncbi:MAG TPA: bifunctional demethylmenaquinone methyltransferase/2-methoxy-6-polyprenyl-1,4-benzoquinol methylase UbiE [Pyrinomonadaceae bacterium]|jgi:demethylmenaquinone methyltransferase/2-methoxy-6-polyprenyl-1,4-benzoquinol methylase|nr:bifunctional demethylmenaquinone methyltransferase/2-methoxy-6-polyprenyl-1,4-benzoquinol methylase UbiE [Pyrinomonadaceae bacterium]